jgi:large subunit ribosomal protein L15
MQANTLKRTHANITTPRVGRGGKRGKTSGRGTKGQKARAGHKMRPEMRDTLKKLPKLRGFGKNRARTVRVRGGYTPINLATLEETFTAGDTVTLAVLSQKGLARSRGGHIVPVKILGTGTLTKKLSLSGVAFSGSAKTAIEAAGGSIL